MERSDLTQSTASSPSQIPTGHLCPQQAPASWSSISPPILPSSGTAGPRLSCLLDLYAFLPWPQAVQGPQFTSFHLWSLAKDVRAHWDPFSFEGNKGIKNDFSLLQMSLFCSITHRDLNLNPSFSILLLHDLSQIITKPLLHLGLVIL